jgi:hypothetical protein
MNASRNPALVRGVLQRAVQGQIVSVDDALHHHRDVLPPPQSQLVTLRRPGYPRVSPSQPVAQLSVSGKQLLDWSIRQPPLPWLPPPLTGADAGSSTAQAFVAVATAGAQA